MLGIKSVSNKTPSKMLVLPALEGIIDPVTQTGERLQWSIVCVGLTTTRGSFKRGWQDLRWRNDLSCHWREVKPRVKCTSLPLCPWLFFLCLVFMAVAIDTSTTSGGSVSHQGGLCPNFVTNVHCATDCAIKILYLWLCTFPLPLLQSHQCSLC